MRRARQTSLDSSQDSPTTDNERDIIWGDSPPTRRICLSTTPGRRVTRSNTAEQDLTDLIECVHPKENKESNTPPLLGLWMRNRQESGLSAKKKQKATRLTRRTTGRKLSRIGLDNDLRVLTEWTGNLAAAMEEEPFACKEDGGSGDAGRSDVAKTGSPEPMDCGDPTIALEGPRAVTEEPNLTDIAKTVKESRRRSTNHSFTDDLWGNDDWDDDDSIIRIATQVENEALTQQVMQQKTEKSQPADVISPTQTGLSFNKTSKKTFASSYKSSNKVNNAMKNVPAEPKGQTQTFGKASPKYVTRNVNNSFIKNTTSLSSRTAQTSSRPLPRNTITSKGSTVAPKPFSAYQNSKTSYAPKNSSATVTSRQASTSCTTFASSMSTTTSSASTKPMTVKDNMPKNVNMNPAHRTWQKPTHKTTTVISSKGGTGGNIAPSNAATKVVPRVPPITNNIVRTAVSPANKQAFDDSLEDLFGDNSLPDDLLLALLDNDSDFEEYSQKAPATVPMVQCDTNKQLSSQTRPGVGLGSGRPNCGSSQTTSSASNMSSSNQCSSKRTQQPSNSRMTTRSSGSGNLNKGSANRSSKQGPGHSAAVPQSMMTNSSAQFASSSYPPKMPGHAPVSDNLHQDKKKSHERRSLSQPVTPTAKKEYVSSQRFCSQLEIEKKRQAALAKRKQSQRKVSPPC